MKKVIACLVVLILAVFPLTLSFSYVDTQAYVGAVDLFTNSFYMASNFSLQAPYDGIYIISSLYKSYYGPDTINSPVKLDNSYFLSGTFNGHDIGSLDSNKLYDLEVAGFSQTVSYSDKGDYFIYSLLTCLPVKAGDNFSIRSSFNSTNVRQRSLYSYVSYIPGGSGLKMVHEENGTFHPENSLSYDVSSKNQHLALVFNPDNISFSSSDGGLTRSSSYNCTSFSGLTSVVTYAKCADFFTTSYNYMGDISVTLKDSIENYSFSVYEIFTDGTTTPGYVQEPEKPTGSGGSDDSGGGGSGSVSVDLSEVLKRLVEIRQAIEDKVIDVTVNVSDAVLDKLDDILSSLKNLPADMWDSFKVGLSDMFQIEDRTDEESPPSESGGSDAEDDTVQTTTESISLEIDQENFDKAMESVDVDNLGDNIGGEKGAIAFFWYFTDKFLDNMGLYTVVYISLFLAFCTWLLRS